MIYLGELVNPRFSAMLGRTLLGLGAVCAMTLTYLGVESIAERGRAGSLEAAIQTRARKIARTYLTNGAGGVPSGKVAAKAGAINEFQFLVSKLAAANGCQIARFQASDRIVPFVSAFSHPPAKTPWGQIEVTLNLSGTTPAVTDTLRGLNRLHVPFEFSSLDLSRAQASAAGRATISANVTLHLITMPGGA